MRRKLKRETDGFGNEETTGEEEAVTLVQRLGHSRSVTSLIGVCCAILGYLAIH
jgi:hypothetical protein